MDDIYNDNSTDPKFNKPASTQENNNDEDNGNFNQSLVQGLGTRGNNYRGKGSRLSDNGFKSLQFKDNFGRVCSVYLKVKADAIRHTDYTYLNGAISFTVSPDTDKVRKQCVLFAVNAMNQAVDGYRITGRRDYNDQVRLIAEVFFYSFYKSMVAMWNGVQNGNSIRSLLFRGHAYTYRLAREGRRLYIDSDGPNVVKYIKFTEAQISSIKTKFEEEFLIAKVANEMLDLDGNFVIPAFENILNRMATGAFKLQGKNTLQVLDDSDSFAHSTLLSQSTCPLGNCFYDSSKGKLFTILDGTTKIKDFSYIMNKASFITFDSYIDDYTEDSSSPPEFVIPVSLNEDDYLLQDEVKYITGLDCLPYTSQMSQYPDSYYPRKGNDLYNSWNTRDFGYYDMFRRPESTSRPDNKSKSTSNE